MFTGTRAEAIVADLGENKRIACGMVPFVLPAAATLRDLDVVNPANKNIPLEIILDSLEPSIVLQKSFAPDEFFYGALQGFYGVNIEDKPKTETPTILVVDMAENGKVEKGFTAKKRLAERISDLLNEYKKADFIFIYNGAASSKPEQRLMNPLRKHAKKAHMINSKAHNPFFNTYLEEMVEDLGNDEIVVVGSELQDKVFYTTLNAKDIDYGPEITVLPDYIMGAMDFGRPVTKRQSGLALLDEHFKEVLGAKTRYDARLAAESRKNRQGVVIYLD